MHVHVTSPDGEAKIWMEPAVELALNRGLRDIEIREIIRVILARPATIPRARASETGQKAISCYEVSQA
jgi:hypothetical protein